MSKYKAGLHKEVSAIFNGVSLPKNDIAHQSSAAPDPGHQDHSAPKLPTPVSPTPVPPASKSAEPAKPAVPAPAAPKPAIPAPAAPKPAVPAPAAPKPAIPAPAAPKPAVPAPAAPKQAVPTPAAPKPAVPAPAAPKQAVPAPAAPKPTVTEPQPPAQEQRAPSHMTSTKPKPQPTPPQPQKTAPAKQPKAHTTVKAVGQAPWQRMLEQIKSKLLAPKPGVSTTKQKAMVIAVPVLFIVLIFVFVRAFSSPSRKIAGPRKVKPVKAVAADAADTKIEWKIPEPYPTTLRDPMQFGPVANVGRADTSGLAVKGIVYSKSNPCAVIGDQIAHEGDTVLGVYIVKINENSVEFEVNGKRWTQRVQR